MAKKEFINQLSNGCLGETLIVTISPRITNRMRSRSLFVIRICSLFETSLFLPSTSVYYPWCISCIVLYCRRVLDPSIEAAVTWQSMWDIPQLTRQLRAPLDANDKTGAYSEFWIWILLNEWLQRMPITVILYIMTYPSIEAVVSIIGPTWMRKRYSLFSYGGCKM